MPNIGRSFVQQIINKTIAAGNTKLSFPVELIRSNNIVECTKHLRLTLSTLEPCIATTRNNNITQIAILNDDGKKLKMANCSWLVTSHLIHLFQWEQ